MPRFDAYEVSLELLDALVPVVSALRKKDRELERQLRRAASKIPAQVREGSRRTGCDRDYLFRTAAGSADEVRGHLETAVRWRYVTRESTAVADALADRVLAMLYRLTHAR
jgi:four helix bundle protein